MLPIGRDAELARLRAAIADTTAGTGRFVLLAGEAGIGKSRLAEAAAEHALAAGARVAWGRCWEAGGAPPYWPWVEALRELGLEDVLGSTGDDDRFVLFDRVMSALLDAARATPLAVVLEDLHVADPTSLALLQALVPRLRAAPLLLLGTERTGESPAPALLRRAVALAEVIELRGLGERAVGELAAASGGRAGDAAVLARATGGNPLFVQALARVYGEGPLPANVRETLARRVEVLPEATRAALGAASVLGRDVPRARLAALCGAGDHELAPAVEAGLLVPTEAPAVLRFAHDVVRELLHASLPPARRAELHARLADELEGDPGRLAEVARHRSAAVSIVGVERALDAFERAARQASQALAFEDAADLYADALALEPVDAPRRAELLLALGEARQRAGDVAAAQDAFAQAANIARLAGLPETLARAALGFGGIVTQAGGTDATVVALLEQALEQCPADAHDLRARLLARLSRELHFGEDPERREALALEALEEAQHGGDLATRGFVLWALHVSIWKPDRLDDRLRAADDLLKVAADAQDPELELQGRTLRAADLIELGRMDDADREIERGAVLAERLRQPAFTWVVRLLEATRDLVCGRFAQAEQSIDDALRVGLPARGDTARRYWVLQEFERRRSVGGLEDLVEQLERNMAADWTRYGITWMTTMTLLGRVDEARAEWERWVADGLGGPMNNVASGSIAFELAGLAAFFDDAHSAAVLHERLAPFAGHWVLSGIGGMVGGSIDHALGLTAWTAGRREEAEQHLRRAVALHRDAGALPALVRSERELARRLAAGGRADEAASLIGHALRTAEALGMDAVARELRAEGEPVMTGTDASLRREGAVWAVAFGGRTIRLKDRKGLAHLARLLAEPHREISAVELVAGDDAVPDGDAGPLLDEQAVREYRRRQDEVEAELDEATRVGDQGRADRAAVELEFLRTELSRAVGLGGRRRRASSTSERARVSATRAVRTALAEIEAEHPELGRHLRDSVRTGSYCRYAPAASQDVRWVVDSA